MNLIKKFFHHNKEVKEEKFEISNDDFEKIKEKFIGRTYSKNDNFLYLKLNKYDLDEFLYFFGNKKAKYFFPTNFIAISSEGKERIFDIEEDKYMPFDIAELKLSSLESKDKLKIVIEEIKFIGNDYGFDFELTLPFEDNMPEYKKVSASYEIPKIEKLKYEEYCNHKKVSLEYFLLTSKAKEFSYLLNKEEIKYVNVFQNGKEFEDTARAMVASYESDKQTYLAMKDVNKEVSLQAKIRANSTAISYNEYILKNSFLWADNIPEDIKSKLEIIE